MTLLLWCVAMAVLDNCCGCRESGQWLWPYCCGVLQWQCYTTVVVAERAVSDYDLIAVVCCNGSVRQLLWLQRERSVIMTLLLWCIAVTVLSYCCGGRESGQWLWPHCCGVLQWQCCPTAVVAERADLNEVTDNRDFTVMSCWDPPSQWVHNCPFSPSGSQCLYPLLYIYIIFFFLSHPNSYFLALYIYIRKKFLFFFSHPNSYFLADWVTYGSIIIVHIIHRTYRQNKQDTTHTHTCTLCRTPTHTHTHSLSLTQKQQIVTNVHTC